MRDFLIGAPFQYAILPLATALLGVGLKLAAKNDRYSSIKTEDFAVGLDLMLTACFLFVMLTTQRAAHLEEANRQLSEVNIDIAQALSATPASLDKAKAMQRKASDLNAQILKMSDQFAASGWYVVLLFVAIGGVSTLVRKRGWKSSAPGEMEPLIGVAIPLLLGVLSLVAVMAEAL
jgi:hypothetical protein